MQCIYGWRLVQLVSIDLLVYNKNDNRRAFLYRDKKTTSGWALARDNSVWWKQHSCCSHYPRGNFSVVTVQQIICICGSLSPCFQLAICIVEITIRRPFAFTLSMTFLPPLRSSLGAPVIFSGACHPSTTTQQSVSFISEVSQVKIYDWCSIVASTTPGEIVSMAPSYALHKYQQDKLSL